MRKLFLLMAVVWATAATAANYDISGSTLTLTTDSTTVEVSFFTPSIVRVVKYPAGERFDKQSLSVIAEAEPVNVKTKTKGDNVVLTTKSLAVTVDTATGCVSFATAGGAALLSEAAPGRFIPVDDAGRQTYKVSQSFTLDPGEQIYGLGILQNGKISQRGEHRDLFPGNTEDGIPFFQSSRGYGLFWDNYSTTRFDDDADLTTLASVVGDGIDYYFIYGGSADGVVAGIRHLSGDVPMAPLWTYGFHQSKERYKSQKETLDVLHRYRTAGIPIDCVIQDWQYWGNNYLWNAMEFMSDQFPDPKGMMDDIHSNNARCMISIWSSFGPHTKPYRQLDDKGLLMDLETWPQSGISHIWPPRMDYPSGVRVYNCYSPQARDIYWDNLRRLYDLGLDAWWMDSTEPDHFNWKESDFDYQTGMGSYRSLRSAFPLMTVGGVYDHQRATSDSTRVFILTRSGAFGQQRYGSNVWSGDVVSTWEMLRNQITAGLNFSLTGNPNFNSDLGGFFAGSYNGAWRGTRAYDNPAYRELYVRWMQQGVFTPMMRSHGADVPRELWYYGCEGQPVYDALVDAIKLRYSLLPYIYSTAREVSDKRGTFMRALVMDFPDDPEAVSLTDEYMFGRSILATPVVKARYTEEVIRRDSDANAGWDKNTGRIVMDLDSVDFTQWQSHEVYLPKGAKWYDYNTGLIYDGGTRLSLEMPLRMIPFFIKAGSIIPFGPDVQYAAEKPWDNLMLRLYPGADGSFTLYEDRGDGYEYERGEFTEIPMTWNERRNTLTIGRRTGSYPGMIERRTFVVVMPDGISRTVEYDGNPVNVKF